MDASPPFAADVERLRLLYRLPLRGDEARILVVGSGVDAERLLDVGACTAAVTVSARPDGGDTPFDAVMLPLCLLGDDEHSIGTPNGQPLAAMLAQAKASMLPGGVVVGHLENIASLASVRSALRGGVSWSGWRSWRGAWGASACLRTLHDAGFEAAECFYVEPRISAPMTIVPRSPLSARAHFVRAIRRTHGHYSMAGYLTRLLLAQLGLGGTLQPHLFFWARRPC